MITNKTLEKKLKELEQKINNIGKEITADYILRYKLDKNDNEYNKIKENLIKRGYEYKSTDKTQHIWYPNYEYEIWEKEMWEQ